MRFQIDLDTRFREYDGLFERTLYQLILNHRKQQVLTQPQKPIRKKPRELNALAVFGLKQY